MVGITIAVERSVVVGWGVGGEEGGGGRESSVYGKWGCCSIENYCILYWERPWKRELQYTVVGIITAVERSAIMGGGGGGGGFCCVW